MDNVRTRELDMSHKQPFSAGASNDMEWDLMKVRRSPILSMSMLRISDSPAATLPPKTSLASRSGLAVKAARGI